MKSGDPGKITYFYTNTDEAADICKGVLEATHTTNTNYNVTVMKDAKKKCVKSSPVVHAYTSKGTKTRTNAKSVSVNKGNSSPLWRGHSSNSPIAEKAVERLFNLARYGNTPTYI